MAKRSPSRPTNSLASLSWTQLESEMRKRRSKAASLVRKRDRLLASAAKLDAQIAAVAGSIIGTARRAGRAAGRSPAARTRAANEGGLAVALQKVLSGATMGVTEVAAAVQKAGYKTGAANFRTIVNACLLKHKNLFKKVARGKYTAA